MRSTTSMRNSTCGCTPTLKVSLPVDAEDLHAAPQTQHKVKSGLLLDIIIGKCAAIFKLLAREDQTLLVGRDAFLVLNLRLDVVDRITRLHVQRDGFARQSLHEDLHAAPQTQHKVKSRLLLDIIIGKCAAIFELLARE